LIKCGYNEPSKALSWKVLETVLSHLNIAQQKACDMHVNNITKVCSSVLFSRQAIWQTEILYSKVQTFGIPSTFRIFRFLEINRLDTKIEIIFPLVGYWYRSQGCALGKFSGRPSGA